MTLPEIVTAQEWEAERAALLVEEKALTRARDALAAKRRRLPMVAFDGEHRFTGADGPAGLLDVFDGRRQLVVYHFMHVPDGWCEGCCMFVDTVGRLEHLHARDTSFAAVSQTPWERLAAHRERMGWRVPFYSSAGTTFDADCGFDAFGISVFLREGDRVFRTYGTTGRAADGLGNHWSLLDLTPFGRQETWEDTPAGRPQTHPYEWWRQHDEY